MNLNQLLLAASLRLVTFSAVIVVGAGVVLPSGADYLFDDDESVCTNRLISMDDKGKEWRIVKLSPNLSLFSKVMDMFENASPIIWEEFMKVLRCPSEESYPMGCCPTVRCVKEFHTSLIAGAVHVDGPLVAELLLDLSDANVTEPQNCGEWIAIVGMACRLPNADNVEEYWDILSQGKNTCSSPTKHRLSLCNLEPNCNGNWLKCPIDEFDASFFGLSPNEAKTTDPQARLALEVSWEAFEDAGINPESLRGSRTGVFYGSWTQDYKDAMNSNGESSEGFLRKYIGNAFGCSAAKLSYFYGFTGPNISTESGCSSSNVAVDMAVKSLQRRECPLAVVAGTNLIYHTGSQSKMLAVDGKSKTFDVGADGYGRAEGVAVILLKRYVDAVQDCDNIHGIILGSSCCQEGLSNSFGTPTVYSECHAMRHALKVANLDPSQVDYVEAHATGTATGDPIEAAAIVRAYSSKISNRQAPLWIASGKTNIGHTESCSGLAGIIKVLLQMKHETICKHVNCYNINPQVDFSPIPGKIPLANIPWTKNPVRPRIAGVNNFGITGTDVHIILREGPAILADQASCQWQDEEHVIGISAKSEVALSELLERWKSFLRETSDSISDIAYTANVSRPQHNQFRIVVTGKTKKDMANHLSMSVATAGANFERAKVCFMFPGLTEKMDLEPFCKLYERLYVFKRIMDDCDARFKQVTGSVTSLTSILMRSHESENIQVPQIHTPEWYALIISCQYSVAKLWMHWGVLPAAVVGYSFGELTAAVLCGAMRLEDLYRLVSCLPYFVQHEGECPSATILVTASNAFPPIRERILSHIQNKEGSDSVEITAINSPGCIAVCGAPRSILNLKMSLEMEDDLTCQYLSTPFSAHSRSVETACKKSLHIFQKIEFHPMSTPYFSCASGGYVLEADLTANHLYKVFRNAVQFAGTCAAVHERNMADIYFEMGAEGYLSTWAKSNLKVLGTNQGKSFALSALHKKGIAKCLQQMVQLGVHINWDAVYGKRHRTKIPGYAFQRKSFWFERASCPSVTKPDKRKHSHPLLGYTIDTPLYQQNQLVIFLNDRICQTGNNDTAFIREHLIGTNVLFPGACFLEMIVSAWIETAPKRKYNALDSGCVVTNFIIHSPLLLRSENLPKVCTIVNLSNGNIEIYASFADGNVRWNRHATATVTEEKCAVPLAASLSNHSTNIQNTCLDDHLQTRDQLEETNNKIQDFYAAASTVGLNFGSSFKSLKSIQNHVTGDSTVEITPVESRGKFHLHPIYLDAMIQAWVAHLKTTWEKLHVPAKINKITLLSSQTQTLPHTGYHIHCSKSGGLVRLISQSGNSVVEMEGIDLVATSVRTVLLAAEKNMKAECPVHLYDVVWNPSEHGHSAEICVGNPRIFPNNSSLHSLPRLADNLSKFDKYSPKEAELDSLINRLCYLYVLKAVYEMGWTIKIGTAELRNRMNDWGILPSLARAFNHYIGWLDEDICELLDSGHVDREISKVLAHEECQNYAAIDVIKSCGRSLKAVLTGSINPHRLLFGEEGLATTYYSTSRFTKILHPLGEIFACVIDNYLAQLNSYQQNGILVPIKILEIGAGTGLFTREAVRILEEKRISFKYYYTDISPTMLARAPALFPKQHITSFLFNPLNIELDPLAQGFPPNYFDIIVAGDVLHATTELRKTLAHIQILAKHGGGLLLGETEKPARETDICFGILEGYWPFNDEIRKSHCTVESNVWMQLMAEQGFTDDFVNVLSCNGQKSAIFARKNMQRKAILLTSKTWIFLVVGSVHLDIVERVGRELTYLSGRRVEISKVDFFLNEADIHNLVNEKVQESKVLEGICLWLNGDSGEMDIPDGIDPRPLSPNAIINTIISITKCLQNRRTKTLPRFHLVTHGSWQHSNETEQVVNSYPSVSLAWGFMRTLRNEMPAIVSKSIDLDNLGGNMDNLIQEIWTSDNEDEVVYREGVRYVRRLKEMQSWRDDEIVIPDCSHFCISLPASKLITDVTFVGCEDEKELLPEHHVNVEIRTAGLNFKDVLAVMKPSKDFESIDWIGLDFAGIVNEVGGEVTKWKVGDAVFGAAWETGSMRCHVRKHENEILQIPRQMTFADAVTLPTVFITAWHSLVNVASLQAGQSVLVHAASGGVGLIAIQIAKMLGAIVFATAGSKKKRRFLRRIGIDNVFDSRSLKYGEEINTLTCSKGVNVVLNCLTGPGFIETTLQTCMNGGHFIELSKMDIWSEQQIALKRPLVKYTIVDVTHLKANVVADIISSLGTILKEGRVTALTYKRFGASQLVHALAFLQKAKHIGKVVVDMPIRSMQHGWTLPLFDNRSTYVITGGMGAIGFAVCRFLVDQGAKYIVLVGRLEASDSIKQEISIMRAEQGASVLCKQLDISDYKACNTLMHDLESDNLPPIRGIHHCAGTLSDKMISNQDWENCETVLRGKVYGAWNLHCVTINKPIDHFVLYSSASATFGNIGQSNYVAANTFLDELANYRQSMGLPALSINWGKWEAGLAKNVEMAWLYPFSIDNGINTLEHVMRWKQPSAHGTVAGNFNFPRLLQMAPHYRDTLLHDIPISSPAPGTATGENDGETKKSAKTFNISEKIKHLTRTNDREMLIHDFILQTASQNLGSSSHDIPVDVDFSHMGMDSLMKIEFENQICSELQPIVPSARTLLNMEKHNSIQALCKQINLILESVMDQ